MAAAHDQVRRESAVYLRDTYLPRLERALEILPDGDLWWRPHEGVLSFGTVLLHLEGNVRQWVLSGLAGAPDHRERAAEFAATGEGAPPAEELVARIGATVREAAGVIEGLSDETLDAAITIQGFETTGLAAVYHVVEHFAWHTGQAVWIAKARAGASHGLAFYDETKVNNARNG